MDKLVVLRIDIRKRGRSVSRSDDENRISVGGMRRVWVGQEDERETSDGIDVGGHSCLEEQR